MKPEAFLIGPFVGELSWEYYRFAPYIIYLKKQNPDTRFIVLTRRSRFDLYGKYADAFLPLKLPENGCVRFGYKGITKINYDLIVKKFTEQFKANYKIKNIINPNISYYFYKVKWQFPKSKMDYDFKPREQCCQISEKVFNKTMIVNGNYNIKTSYHYDYVHDLLDKITNLSVDNNSTHIGCMIEIIKKCKFVVSNINNEIGQLALLLNVPVISINEKMSDDEVHLLNPHNTQFFKYNVDEKGVIKI